MSLREEDGPKNSSTSRGLGIAAAAIGVGVGAALYYFFSKRPEHPDSAGSTSQWQQRPQAFGMDSYCNCGDSEDDFLTTSEHTTSDTSVYNSSSDEFSSEDYDTYESEHDSDMNDSDTYHSESSASSEYSASNDNEETGYLTSSNDSGSDDWEVMSEDDVPPRETSRGYASVSPLTTLLNVMLPRRSRKSRERSWTLEECTICFDVILKDQESMSLPCTHNFHSGCILPWLQEQQTCPVCRASAK